MTDNFWITKDRASLQNVTLLTFPHEAQTRTLKAICGILGHLFIHPSLSLSPPGINRVSANLGHNTVMTCPTRTNISMVTWKINPKTGHQCTLAYRIDKDSTGKTNCSDRINWRSRPDWDQALEIQQVGKADEGNYTCEVVNADRNFHRLYHLTVLGKGLLPHFTVLQSTVSRPGHTKLLLSLCSGSSVR